MARNFLNENDLRRIVREAILNEIDNLNDKIIYSREQKALYAEFENFLKRSGVRSASINDSGNGSYSISIPSNEYNYQIFDLASKYAEKKGMRVRTSYYPATTYLRLEKE